MKRIKTLVVGFEGLPGCGKTTVIRLLIQTLWTLGMDAISVDADTSRHAAALRAAADALPLNNLVRMVLFWEMRKLQYTVIEGLWGFTDVIFADRTFGTALAYDVYGNGVSRELLDMIGQNLAAPDITFLFCVPLAVAQARKKSRTMEDPAFARRVERGYAELARAHEWICVDATQTPEKVTDICLAALCAALKGTEGKHGAE